MGGGNLAHSYSQIFWDSLPIYMAMGMSAEEFWHRDPKLAEAYRKSYELKKYAENENMWLQGAYVYQALVSASPCFAFQPQNPQPYLERPMPLDEKEAERMRLEREADEYEKMKARFREQVSAINNNLQRKEE